LILNLDLILHGLTSTSV